VDNYLKGNRKLWNELTPIHENSDFYDVKSFKANRSILKSIELAEVGEVSGKSLLHLQCHFGMDTLSWARAVASVTGVAFSDKAITLAQSLSRDLNIKASFICCDIFDLPQKLQGNFDIVFTSYGVLCWLPDLIRWAEIINHFLKPGGFFYIVEGHPIMNIFNNSKGVIELNVTQSYFHKPEPIKWDPEGDYADKSAIVVHPSYEWTHSLGDIINALAGAGLRIDFLHEFPVSAYPWSDFTQKGTDGWWHIEGDKIPMVFSIKATKPISR
jgi:SAM-dependent methyltransferase